LETFLRASQASIQGAMLEPYLAQNNTPVGSLNEKERREKKICDRETQAVVERARTTERLKEGNG